jgi:hypothetical protein
MNKRINQYITDYEELDPDYENDENSKNNELNDEMKALMIEMSSFSSLKSSNTKTFMTSFESMKTSEILIADLPNRSFSHSFIKQFIIPQTDLKDDEVNALQIDMKDIDSFTYLITHSTSDLPDRYFSKRFYEIMIDLDVSRYSTTEYEQYLAYVRNNDEKMDIIKTETIHVQFDIDFIYSVESLTIDISIETVKFYIVKIDTSFFLSLADMNRLKVYFNNVENILIKKKIRKENVFSVIRRFDHDFLL